MNNKKKIVEDNCKMHGFRRGLDAEKIIGAADDNGVLMYLMQWKGTDVVDLVSSTEANINCPQVVIQFYKDRMTWDVAKSSDK
ncbi:hypothetical protein DMN91_007351 [Ooceraea biroi]|uniref:Chromo domain-containing protein n=1 Tax=Ooceraea biroi TaxID=2015173 RepID=A0A3L8DLM9_OOCBI|nr:chromobox protein homolog 1 [Ooceraea biroi]XP_011349898.1 chromobox protein homolog 1 [Ooceraea biroi]XP_011349899.1 chromobox protein homolog 1 [Ooceraea biroi]RLU20738.1 hypothetical protein DMN91_007351 [Ooceraea biroi]